MAYQQTLPVDTELIGDFRILGLLGSGGFANTYLALDLTLGREVAIKEFFPSDLAIRANTQSVAVKSAAQESQFQWAMGRFVREAKTLAQFRHPSVVRVYRVFNANDTAYIVLEFVRGANMGTWLKRLGRPPTQAELDEILPPLIDALEVVHKAGILHRDIKPANIYIREADQTPVLLDFGAAKYAAGAAGDHGTTAAIVSKGYSPNEAYASDSRLQGPWTDLYGLAATLYRALTGSAPPESTSRILNDECVPLATMPELAGTYRPEFLAAVDWALAVMPKERPQSVAQWRSRVLPAGGERPSRPDSRPSAASEPEWRPLSDSTGETATIYSKNLPSAPSAAGSSAGRASAPKGEASAPSRGTPPSASRGPSGARAPSRPSTAGGEAQDEAASVPTVVPAAIAPRAWVSNPMFLAGVALFAAGFVGLASQWLGGSGTETKADRTPATRVAALDAEREAERRRLAAEEVERVRKEQEEAAAERAQQEAERQRLAAEEAERVRKEQEEAAAERARQEEAERQRLAAQEAERARQAEEEARRAAEAERLRAAQEAAERARQEEAERQRLAAEAEEAERVRKEQEAARRAEEERLAKAAEEERRKQEEEDARKRQEASAAGTSEIAPGGTQVAALDPNVVPPADRRRAYLSRMQSALKERACYTGSVNGDLDDTVDALSTFETSYKGTPRTINLASASDGDFEDWLGWFAALKDADCVERPPVTRPQSEPARKRVQSKPKPKSPGSQAAKSKAPPASVSRDSLLRGGR